MLNGWLINGADAWGSTTQSAGTVITRLITPRKGLYTNLVSLVYTSSSTQHTLTLMRPFNWTTFTADAAASQAVVNIAADPGAYATLLQDRQDDETPSVADNGIAANDFVVYELPDGNYVLDTVSSVSSLAVTLTTNLPTGGVKKGGKLWFFGVIANSNPHTGVAHATLSPTTSATTSYPSAGAGLVPVLRSTHQDHPMIIHSGNASNAGTIVSATAIYTKN